MSDKYSYAEQKFDDAVAALVGNEPLRRRLGWAWQALANLREHQLPPSISKEVLEMCAFLADGIYEHPYHGHLTVRTHMPRSGKIASRIFEIYRDLKAGRFD